jgi:hypothetical protein
MILRVNESTWLDPRLTRAALVTEAQSDEHRRLWVVSIARPDEPIEVEKCFQEELLQAMRVTLS